MQNLYLVANKTSKTFVAKTLASSSAVAINIIATTEVIAPSFLVAYEVSNVREKLRIQNGDYFDLVWTGDLVSRIDFTRDDERLKIVSSSSKQIVVKCCETIDISLKVVDKDMNTVTDFDETIVIPIITPAGAVLLKAKFTDGVCAYTFDPKNSMRSTGHYCIPSSNTNNICDYKIFNKCEFDVVITVGV